jgi:hypothetical protein
MTDLSQKVTVVIRSVGERTEQLCQELILAQGIPTENLFIIREAPFSAALHKSFEIGIANGLPWTLCNDADVLLRPGSINKMLSIAETHDQAILEFQGLVIDKFFGGPRPGGPHLYRTNLIIKAMEHFEVARGKLRPESVLLNTMKSKGYPWLSLPEVFGLHDSFQYYKDIYRKCFVFAHKNQALRDLFLSIWSMQIPHDRDFQVAFMGFAAGNYHNEKVEIDSMQDIYELNFDDLPFDEKKELDDNFLNLNEIESIISNWVEPSIYQSIYTPILKKSIEDSNSFVTILNSKKKKYQYIFKKYLRAFTFIIGDNLHNIGKKIMSLSKKIS